MQILLYDDANVLKYRFLTNTSIQLISMTELLHILQAHYQSISFAPFTSAFLACFWAMIIPPARATIAFII